jgi:hypothetical protein
MRTLGMLPQAVRLHSFRSEMDSKTAASRAVSKSLVGL